MKKTIKDSKNEMLSTKNKYSVKDFTNDLNSLHRCFMYILKSSLRSVRTYIYSIVLPIIVSIGLYFWNSMNGLNLLRPICVSALTLIPSITMMFFVSFLISEWKESIFLKQLVNMKINKIQFILSFYFVTIIIGFISTIINLLVLYSMDFIFNEKSVTNMFLNTKNFSTWFLYAIAILFSITLNFNVGMLISGISKSSYVVQTINIALLIFVLFASDIIIDPNLINDKYKYWFYLCYIVPQKYMNWFCFMCIAQMQKHSYNIELIIPSLSSYIFMTKMWMTSLSSFFISYSLFAVTYFTFRQSFKK